MVVTPVTARHAKMFDVVGAFVESFNESCSIFGEFYCLYIAGERAIFYFCM